MITIGSRGSQLALAQSSWVKAQIESNFPGTEISIKMISTAADRDQTRSLREGSGTGVFVKEIESALIAGEIDLAVHSMKDVPTRMPEGLAIAAIPPREDPRDAMISRKPAARFTDLPQNARIGTGSIRRQAQLLALRPDLRIEEIRGNVDSRLAKLGAAEYDAIILACAGLNRLGLMHRISLRLEIEDMLPAPGQGALALEIREGDQAMMKAVAALDHAETSVAVRAEREFLRAMGGGCNSPIAAYARVESGRLRIDGLAALPDGSRIVRESISVAPAEGMLAAAALAQEVLARGGRGILEGQS